MNAIKSNQDQATEYVARVGVSAAEKSNYYAVGRICHCCDCFCCEVFKAVASHARSINRVRSSHLS